MGFLLEVSKKNYQYNHQYQSSEVDCTIILIILGFILLYLFIYLIQDYIKNGPNTFSDDVPHPFVDYLYPGWKHLAEQPGEGGKGIRSIRRKYYGINDTYIKCTNTDKEKKNKT